MKRRFPLDTTKVKDVVAYSEQAFAGVDDELTKLREAGQVATVGSALREDLEQSHLFIDDGVLKFYNSATGAVSTVTLT